MKTSFVFLYWKPFVSVAISAVLFVTLCVSEFVSGAIGVVIGVSVVMIWNERSRVKLAREVSVKLASKVSVQLASE